MFVSCYAVHCFKFFSSFADILMGKRELVALLCMSPWCRVLVCIVTSIITLAAVNKKSPVQGNVGLNKSTSIDIHCFQH